MIRAIALTAVALITFTLPTFGKDEQPQQLQRMAQSNQAEILFWQSVKDGKDPDELEAYLTAYPSGVFASLARIWLNKLKRSDTGSRTTEVSPKPVIKPKATPVTPDAGLNFNPGGTFRDCAECPEMVVIPAGSFTMGSPRSERARAAWVEAYKNEGPQHKVTIPSMFAVGKFEVTFEEWDACVTAGGCKGYRPDDKGWGRNRLPVISVSWDDAKSYVDWLSGKTGETYRLLSESEWEYVARAGTTTPFSTGQRIYSEQANFNGEYNYNGSLQGHNRGKTVPVGTFTANAFGLHDVHGNVWEWVEDCYHDTYKGAPKNGSVWSGGDCSNRVSRGGAWINRLIGLHSAVRNWAPPGSRNVYFGFRVARAVPMIQSKDKPTQVNEIKTIQMKWSECTDKADIEEGYRPKLMQCLSGAFGVPQSQLEIGLRDARYYATIRVTGGAWNCNTFGCLFRQDEK